jgi:ADP-heptose:LPS heptosyltransferase
MMSDRRVVVFRCGQLGDTIVALPALWSIRTFFGDAPITYLADHHPNSKYVAARSVLPAQGLVDDWMTYDARSRPTDLFKLAMELRNRRFTDLVYLVPSRRTESQRQRDMFFFRAAGLKHIWGDRAFPVLPNKQQTGVVETPEYRQLLRRLEASGIPAVYRHDLGITTEERSSVERWLVQVGILSGAPIVTVAPGTKASSKQWPVERFAKVLKHVRDRAGLIPVIVGGPEDAELGHRILKEVGCGAIAAGALSVRATAALMEHCTLFLGNDTGAMHLAAAAERPCVVPFSAQDWRGRWYPVGGPHVILRVEIECEGCQLTTCPRQNECLTRIGVDDVTVEVDRVLDRLRCRDAIGTRVANGTGSVT